MWLIWNRTMIWIGDGYYLLGDGGLGVELWVNKVDELVLEFE